MTKHSFYVQSDRLQELQELVKVHDGRFLGNPTPSGSNHYVQVGFDYRPDTPSERRFLAALSLLKKRPALPPPQLGFWRKLFVSLGVLR